jgi:hypothetical protein
MGDDLMTENYNYETGVSRDVMWEIFYRQRIKLENERLKKVGLEKYFLQCEYVGIFMT